MIRLALISMMIVLAVLAHSALASPTEGGRTYYVDYDSGSDANAGTSPTAAFRHAPGDPAATGRAKAVTPTAGDTVIFKGGVRYRGELVISGSGAAGRPITYDGNTAGTFGIGRAILDGGERLTGWQRCASADECGGNPNWRHIWRTKAPATVTALSANLVQDGRLGVLAQHPNPADPLFTDNTAEYLRVPTDSDKPRERIVDPRLAGLGGEDLVGAYVHVWRRTNQIDTRMIRHYDPAANAITIEPLGGGTYAETRYALVNSLSGGVFDQPGEYVVVEGDDNEKPTIYLWPLDKKDPSTADVTVTIRSLAISLAGDNHFITIRGFKIQNYRRALYRRPRQDRARGVEIRDNEITQIKAGDYSRTIEVHNTEDLVVAGNYLHECPKMRGITTHTGTGASIRNNRLVRMGRTPISMFAIVGGEIIGNTVKHCRGMHSNGMSVYAGNRDVLIEGNRVYDANVPLTVNTGTNITIRNNIYDGGTHQPISFWQEVGGRVIVENNILIGGRQNSGLCLGGLGDRTGETFDMELIVRDNIMEGPPINIMNGRPWPMDVHSGNVYLTVPVGFDLGPGERVIEDASTAIPGAGRHDYQPAPGIDAGPGRRPPRDE